MIIENWNGKIQMEVSIFWFYIFRMLFQCYFHNIEMIVIYWHYSISPFAHSLAYLLCLFCASFWWWKDSLLVNGRLLSFKGPHWAGISLTISGTNEFLFKAKLISELGWIKTLADSASFISSRNAAVVLSNMQRILDLNKIIIKLLDCSFRFSDALFSDR